jgi:molybdopterin-guanine dinucleotide biosynthesis protein A
VTAAGIVLCGGRSSRMGRAKAWLPWGGRPMVAHVVDVLRKVVDEVVVVTAADLDVPRVDARVVRDRAPHGGPLAGILEGLEHIAAERAFVTGTDAPFLTPAFVAAMLGAGEAAAPLVDDFVQTLSAVYPRSARARAEELLAAGRRRPLDLLEAMEFRRVPPSELPDTASTRGFNTPDAYLDASRERFGAATATLELVGRARAQLGIDRREVPIGTLREALSRLGPGLEIERDGRVLPPFIVSLGGREFVRDTAVPIGPDERAIVLDASAGG